MRRGIIFMMMGHAFCTQVAEESDGLRSSSKGIQNCLKETLMNAVEGIKVDSQQSKDHLGVIIGMYMGNYGNADELLKQSKIAPISYYLSHWDIRKSPKTSYLLGRFAYTQGLKRLGKQILEACTDEDRADINHALGIIAAYDDNDIPLALKYFNAGKSGIQTSISANILRYMLAPDEGKIIMAKNLKISFKRISYLTGVSDFDVAWFIANILNHTKSFKEIESLLLLKTKLGEVKAQMHLYQLYASDVIALSKARTQHELLVDLALNKKQPKAQYLLGSKLSIRNWHSSAENFRLDGYALCIQSYKQAQEELILDDFFNKIIKKYYKEIQKRKVQYDPYWNIGPIF